MNTTDLNVQQLLESLDVDRSQVTDHRTLRPGDVVLINGTMRHVVVGTSTLVGQDVILHDEAKQTSHLFAAHVSDAGSALWWTGMVDGKLQRLKVKSLGVIARINLDKRSKV